MISYVNRKNQTYYLSSKLTKTGKKRYFFTLNANSFHEHVIPIGFEIYESPVNANVLLRKIKKKLFNNEEEKTIQDALNKNKSIMFYKIDYKGDRATIYTAENKNIIPNNIKINIDEFNLIYSKIVKSGYLEPIMQIIKTDESYFLRRMTFRGNCDWFYIDSSSNLKILCKKYFKHIYQESFFELM